jgi:hypothetical protein
MKKNFLSSITRVIVLVALVVAAVAGQVYDRATKALSVTLGTGTWTNTADYAAIELKRIWIENALETNGVYTVSRITSGGTYTQTIGTITMAALKAGSTASFTAAYLKQNDMIYFSSTVATGATAVIEYEVQKH